MRAAGVIAFAALALANFGADALPAQGDAMSGHIEIAGATVLLPPGPWVVGGSSREPAPELGGADVESVALLQAGPHGVTSIVLAQRSAVTLAQRPDLSAECSSHSALFTATPSDDAAGGVCAAVLILRVNTRENTAKAWRIAAEFAADRHWSVPSVVMVAAFRVVDRESLLDVRYATTLSEIAGATPNTCASVMAAIGEPALQQRLDGVTRFTTSLLPVIDLAGGHDLAAIDAAPPLPAPKAMGPGLLARVRLSRIDAMQRDGILPAAEADALRAALQSQDSGDPLTAEILRRAAWKTGTFRMVMATGAMGMWTYAAGDPLFALGMVALQNVLITPINYGIEVGWTSIGTSLGLSARSFTLPSIGTACQR